VTPAVRALILIRIVHGGQWASSQQLCGLLSAAARPNCTRCPHRPHSVPELRSGEGVNSALEDAAAPTTLISICTPLEFTFANPCSLGEGVNSALEDAAILGTVAAECGADGGAIAAAFDRRRRQVLSWRLHLAATWSLAGGTTPADEERGCPA
jgi:hypothetical protein